MTREHLSKPHEGMKILPENSRYWMRWNNATKNFNIGKRNQDEEILKLDYETGRYVYATLRGQQRMEEMAKSGQTFGIHDQTKDKFMEEFTHKNRDWDEDQLQGLWKVMSRLPQTPRGGKNPAVTHRHLFLGDEKFVRSEDAKKRGGMDLIPRSANREQSCFDAVRCFAKEAGLNRVRSMTIGMSKFPTYQRLAEEIRRNDLPYDLEIVVGVRQTKNGVRIWETIPAHEFIVLEEAGGEYICFEKVGNKLPWRLTSLREIYDMYERDYKLANQGKGEERDGEVDISWIGHDLEKATN